MAILGTTLSPYLFFWQSADRAEEMRDKDGRHGRTLHEQSWTGRRHTLQEARVDVVTGMLFSEVVMFAVIVATAATVRRGDTKISTAAEAAQALQPVARHLSTVLFALGFIGTGLLAVPVLAASASSGIAGLLGK